MFVTFFPGNLRANPRFWLVILGNLPWRAPAVLPGWYYSFLGDRGCRKNLHFAPVTGRGYIACPTYVIWLEKVVVKLS